jgi:hypothetical protein
MNFISTKVPPFTNPFQMTFSYDPALGLLNIKAELPVNTWLGIGFGPDMSNTDMILMQANTNVSKSSISDMWSTGLFTPAWDKVDNL